jgi:outer membrane protein assembly factor BamD
VSNRICRVMAGLLSVMVIITLTTGCAAKKKKKAEMNEISYLSASEQYGRARDALSKRDLRRAKTILQRVQYTKPEERSEVEPLVRLAMADANFYGRHGFALIDSRSLYLDFVTLYGDHLHAPYSQFQAGMCSFKQVINPSRDQTRTRQAINELTEVERRYPGSGFAGPAHLMVRRAEDYLAEHEFAVGRFYLKKKSYAAAADRFRAALEKYPGYSDREKLYFHMGRALLGANNNSEARIYLDKLVTDYPEGKYSDDARKALSEAGGALNLDVGM